MSFLVFFFYFLTLCSSIFMILCINPINSVLFLIFIFFNTSMIFILLNVDFLGLLFLMIYVGAIAVLFLFIVMMLNIKKIERDQTVYLTIGGFFLFFYFLQIFFLIFYNSLVYLPEYFFNDSYLYSFSSINFLDESARFFLIKKLGILLYYEYFFLLWFVALILFVSMVGAIYLTNNKQGFSMKRQFYQLSRNHYLMNISIY